MTYCGIVRSIPVVFVVIITLLLIFNVHKAEAAQTIPYKVNFQGSLTDASGSAKPDGLYNIKFRLMSASSGGSNLWQGDRVRGASDYRVQVTNGLFNVQLGDTTLGDPALSPTLFNTQTNATIYLEVELPTPATATCSTNGCATFTEGAMTPRSLIGSSAYAFNSDTVDGIDGASLARNDANNTFSGNTQLFKNGSNSSTAFQIQNTASDVLFGVDTSAHKVTMGASNTSTLPQLVVTQASTGDTALSVQTTANKYYAGIDASDSSSFKLGNWSRTEISGIKSVVSSETVNNANFMTATLVQAGASGTVTKVSVYIGSVAAGNMQVALYSDTSRTSPNAPLNNSSSVALSATNSWYDVTIPSTSVTAGTYYWVVLNFDNATAAYKDSGFAQGSQKIYYSTATTFGTWPGTWSGNGWLMNWGFGAKMEINASAVTDQFARSPLSVASDGQILVKSSPNVPNAFQIQNSEGVALFNASTSSMNVTMTAGDRQYKDILTVTNVANGSKSSNANGIDIDYYGSELASAEQAGLRIDTWTGSASGSTTNGLRFVANSGAVSGVTSYGIKLEGPASPGAGTEVGMKIDANWDAGLEMGAKVASATADAAAAPTGSLRLYAREHGGRSLLKARNSLGRSYPFQPGLFGGGQISMCAPSTGTAMLPQGNAALACTTDTTGSTPTSTEALGLRTQFATAATSGDEAGVSSVMSWYRGSTTGFNGFFYQTRLIPSSNTSVRMFAGLTSDTLVNMGGSDNPASTHHAGFQFSTARGDSNWMFVTKDGSTQATPASTTIAATASNVYELTMYVADQGTTIYWEVDNLTAGTVATGSTTSNLPGGSTQMRHVEVVEALTTSARNIQLQYVYIETNNIR